MRTNTLLPAFMPPVSVLVTSGLFRAKQELPTTVFFPLFPPRTDDKLFPFFTSISYARTRIPFLPSCLPACLDETSTSVRNSCAIFETSYRVPIIFTRRIESAALSIRNFETNMTNFEILNIIVR